LGTTTGREMPRQPAVQVPGGEAAIENLGVGQANVLKEIGKSSEIFPKARTGSDLHSEGDIDSKRL
jgi:hypothetical protein